MFVRWFRFCFSNLTLIPLRWLNKCYSLVSTPRWAPLYFHHPPCLFLITRGIKTKKSFIFIIAIVKQTSSKWKYTDHIRVEMYLRVPYSAVVPPRQTSRPSPFPRLARIQISSPGFEFFKKSRVVEKLRLHRHMSRSTQNRPFLLKIKILNSSVWIF